MRAYQLIYFLTLWSWSSHQQFLIEQSLNQRLSVEELSNQHLTIDQSLNRHQLQHHHQDNSNNHVTSWSNFNQAIHDMQNEYFELWIGIWPTAIDWTAAVMVTHLSSLLLPLANLGFENLLNKYFGQITAFFYNQDVLSLRLQANDDMLWVVLAWLETLRFMKLNPLHLSNNDTKWYGNQFSQPFAHRARIFYELASFGWDETSCHGGMKWNSHLPPYKNAITNQLFITSSISMYLYFPGDNNSFPFYQDENKDHNDEDENSLKDILYPPNNPAYRDTAIKAYDWLKRSIMLNDHGLYIDGFHLIDNECLRRDEMVFTYNQGVILPGLRGLWESTGEDFYLEDAYTLIRNTIASTGYVLDRDPQTDDNDDYTWHGLGRNGVLEDACDRSGTCNQDAQTFKGIYFHHMARFCSPLPTKSPLLMNQTYVADPRLAQKHRDECKRYLPWVKKNALAALSTRNKDGLFGMWWTEKWAHGQMSVSSKDQVLKNRDLNDRGRGRTLETQSGGVGVLRALWEFNSWDEISFKSSL